MARFAASPDFFQAIRAGGAPDVDRLVNEYQDYLANFQSKGLAPEAAMRAAEEALLTNQPPSVSPRYAALRDFEDDDLDSVS